MAVRVALKAAIVRSGKSQRLVAVEAELTENRLSELVCGWVEPKDTERDALARILQVEANALFGADATVEIRASR